MEERESKSDSGDSPTANWWSELLLILDNIWIHSLDDHSFWTSLIWHRIRANFFYTIFPLFFPASHHDEGLIIVQNLPVNKTKLKHQTVFFFQGNCLLFPQITHCSEALKPRRKFGTVCNLIFDGSVLTKKKYQYCAERSILRFFTSVKKKGEGFFLFYLYPPSSSLCKSIKIWSDFPVNGISDWQVQLLGKVAASY